MTSTDRPTYGPGDILRETDQAIREILKERIEPLTVERVVMGLFFTGVKLSDGTGGLCFTPIKAIPEAVCCPSSAKVMPASGKLKGRRVTDYLDELFSANPLKRTLGIAVLNALSMSCWEKRPPVDYAIRTRTDAIDELAIPEEGYVVVVGALVPALKKLKARGKPFGILELDPSTLKPNELPFHIPVERMPEAVAKADMLIITGTTLINDTLEDLLSRKKPAAPAALVGPTASMLPGAFFRRGITVVGGVLVTDADRVLDVIAEGGSGYHFFEKGAERLTISIPSPNPRSMEHR
jgi:uncharacterized protein (DUF4213/DUF364 family)